MNVSAVIKKPPHRKGEGFFTNIYGGLSGHRLRGFLNAFGHLCINRLN